MLETDIQGPEHSPFRIIPHLGQIPEKAVESPNREEGRVFQQYESRARLANNSQERGVIVLADETTSVAGGTDALAGYSCADDINPSPPRSGVESNDIVPYWESGQDSVPLALQQDAPAIGLNLDSTYGGMSEKHSAEHTPSGPSEEVEFSESGRKV
jgi:hypothetical protein